jgi:hypothetical protein
MKFDCQLTFEKSEAPLVQNVCFRASSIQAKKVFYALAFALVYSDCDIMTLFVGEKALFKCEFNHRDQIPTFTNQLSLKSEEKK